MASATTASDASITADAYCDKFRVHIFWLTPKSITVLNADNKCPKITFLQELQTVFRKLALDHPSKLDANKKSESEAAAAEAAETR